MIRSGTIVCIVTLLGAPLGGCGSSGSGGPSGEQGPGDATGEGASAPGWRALHAAIIAPSCALSACHSGPKGIGGLSLEDADDSYAALLGQSPRNGAALAEGYLLVAPGEPERSFLLRKVSRDQEVLAKSGHGSAMPVGNLDRLGPESLKALTAWIAAGAPLEGASVQADFVAPAKSDSYVECEATDEEGMRACFPAAPVGVQVHRLYSPPIEIPAGSDVQLCSISESGLDNELFITGADGKQFAGGHHIAIYTAAAALAPGVVDCNTIDMSSLRFVVQAGGGLNTSFEAGLALRVPKGQQLVIQSHYINTKPHPVVVMDAVDLLLTELTPEVTLADSWAMLDSDFEIPPFTFGYERVKECEVVEPMELVMYLGHTHEYGAHFRLEYLPKEGSVQELYVATDGATLRDNPEIKTPSPPLALQPGDKLRMTCVWNNDTAKPVRWPEEMCVAFTYYIPARGWLVCDTNDTHPKVLGATSEGDGCLQPGATGNSMGVGTYCEAGGNQCAGNGAANFCLAAFSSTDNYCSVIFCASDDECGEGARCIEDGPGSACILEQCAE